MVAVHAVAEPLHSGDADRSIEDTGAERYTLSHVAERNVAVHVALRRNVQHVRAYVKPDPGVPHLRQHGAAEAASAADVEDKARLLLWKR